MKYKVGDKVRVRTDLKVGNHFNNVIVVKPMSKLRGQVLTIFKVDIYHYVVKENAYCWTDEMLEDACWSDNYFVEESAYKWTDEMLEDAKHEHDFMWAVEQMTQGKKVRRANQRIRSDDCFHIGGADRGVYDQKGNYMNPNLAMVQATDWEIYEEPKETLWDKKLQTIDGEFDEDDVKEALNVIVKYLKNMISSDSYSEYEGGYERACKDILEKVEKNFGKEFVEK